MSWAWISPAQAAAVALLRIEGTALPPRLFDRAVPEVGRSRFARLLNADSSTADEVVALRLGEQMLELCCHAGSGVRDLVEAALASHGLHPAPLTADPAWDALATAPSPAALSWLMAHPDTAPPFAPEFLRRPPRVLITGAPNAGKSSLLNHWCGYQRAIVSAQAGTTRDLVTATVLVQGWRIELCDSAGLRAHTTDRIERAGQDLVAVARAAADLVLHCSAADQPTAPAAATDLLLHTKADLGTAPAPALVYADPQHADQAQADRWLQALERAVLGRLGLAVPAG